MRLPFKADVSLIPKAIPGTLTGRFSSITSGPHLRNSHQRLSSLSFQSDHPPGLAHHRASHGVHSHRPASSHSYSQSQNAQPRRSPLSSCDVTGATANAVIPALMSGRGSSSVRLHRGSSTSSMDGGSSLQYAGSAGGHSGSLGIATSALKKTLGKLVPQALSMVSSVMGRPGPSGLRVASIVRSEVRVTHSLHSKSPNRFSGKSIFTCFVQTLSQGILPHGCFEAFVLQLFGSSKTLSLSLRSGLCS